MYKGLMNKLALQSIKTAPNIPDFHLMVGSAETHHSLPVLVYQNAKIPSDLVQNMHNIQAHSQEDVHVMIANNQLEVNDLNWNLALIGNGLGGVAYG